MMETANELTKLAERVSKPLGLIVRSNKKKKKKRNIDK